MARQYLKLLDDILANGTSHEDRTGTGTTRLFGYQMRFDLSDGFPLLTTKKMWWKGIVEELLWMLSGSTNEHDLRDRGVDIWKEWATAEQCERFGREPGDLGPVYGWAWRNFGATRAGWATSEHQQRGGFRLDGVDQIANILDQLINNPNSRRIILTGWSPREATQVALPPCHTLTQFVVRDGKLSAQLYQRSADVFLGVPFNIASYALLTHMLAHVCGLQVGEFIHTFGDVHIYNNHIEQVKEQLAREPRKLPSLRIVTPEWEGEGWSFDRRPENALHHLLHITRASMRLDGYDPYPKIKAEVSV